MQETIFLKEIERMAEIYPPLTAKEEDQLARKAATGDKEARELLIKHNARRVLFFAKMLAFGSQQPMKEALSYYTGRLSIDEALSEAMMALWKAIWYFNPEKYSTVAKKKVKFSSWANFVMRQHLRGVAVKKMKEQDTESYEEWKRVKVEFPIEKEPDQVLAEERFWEIFSQLSDEDQEALLTLPYTRKAYKAAIKKLKELASEEEWRILRRLLD